MKCVLFGVKCISLVTKLIIERVQYYTELFAYGICFNLSNFWVQTRLMIISQK